MNVTKLIVCVLLALSAAFAQDASLNGFVADGSGAVIAGVQVTVANTGTGIERAASTNSEGYYAFTALPPGNYALRGHRGGLPPRPLAACVPAQGACAFASPSGSNMAAPANADDWRNSDLRLALFMSNLLL